MKTETHYHNPVMLDEVIENFQFDPNGIYIDATFGRGGHSQAILNQLSATGRLIAFDKDLTAVEFANTKFKTDTRFYIHHGSFADLQQVADKLAITGQVSGILFDLGMSSPQLDEPDRGFSFMRDGKLDMRMNTTFGQDAASWLASVKEEELINVLFKFGEEKFSRRISRAIVTQREIAPIETTLQLANVVSQAIPKWEKGKHPATRSFQAIRIAINKELEELSLALVQALTILKPHGRMLVISFHSLEDRIVKQFIQQQVEGTIYPPGFPIKQDQIFSRMKRIKKALKPSTQEVSLNPRARSAILRIAEKLQ